MPPKQRYTREEIVQAALELVREEGLYRLIQRNTGLSREQAMRFHLESWVYVHGIAVMQATYYLDWPVEEISAVMTDLYEGLKYRFTKGGREDGGHPDTASQ